MPLTETEAQELIAEIKRYFENPMINCSVGYDVEKIINRFANRPPYSLTTDDGMKKITVQPHTGIMQNGITLISIVALQECIGADDGVIGLTKDELSKHIDNCQSMLEYLNND